MGGQRPQGVAVTAVEQHHGAADDGGDLAGPGCVGSRAPGTDQRRVDAVLPVDGVTARRRRPAPPVIDPRPGSRPARRDACPGRPETQSRQRLSPPPRPARDASPPSRLPGPSGECPIPAPCPRAPLHWRHNLQARSRLPPSKSTRFRHLMHFFSPFTPGPLGSVGVNAPRMPTREDTSGPDAGGGAGGEGGGVGRHRALLPEAAAPAAARPGGARRLVHGRASGPDGPGEGAAPPRVHAGRHPPLPRRRARPGRRAAGRGGVGGGGTGRRRGVRHGRRAGRPVRGAAAADRLAGPGRPARAPAPPGRAPLHRRRRPDRVGRAAAPPGRPAPARAARPGPGPPQRRPGGGRPGGRAVRLGGAPARCGTPTWPRRRRPRNWSRRSGSCCRR